MTDRIIAGTFAELLYNTSSLQELVERLAIGPTDGELERLNISLYQWQKDVQLAKRAIERD